MGRRRERERGGEGAGLPGERGAIRVAWLTVLAAALALGRPVGAQSTGPVRGVPASVPSVTSVTFRSAFERVRGEHERVGAASAAVRRAEAERLAAWGRFLPEVEVTGRHTRVDSPMVMDLAPIRGAMVGLHPGVPAEAVPPFVAQIQGERFDRMTLEATVPLFTGGRRVAGVRAAGAATRAAEAERRSALDGVTVELTERYFGLRLAEAAVAARAEAARSLSGHAERARLLETHGQVARAERLRAEVAAAEASRALLAAERDRSLARAALASTLSVDGPVTASTPLFLPEGVGSLAEWRARAQEANPALARAEAGRQQAEAGVRAARGELLPSVALFGMRELLPDELTILEPAWAVGVAVRVPVLAGGRRWQGLRAARARAEEVGLRVSRGRQDVALLVERRYRELQEARDRLIELDATRELAEESLRAQEVAFGAGLATSLDVVDAEAALSRVRLGRQKALYDADVALVRLLAAAGETDRLPALMGATADETAGKTAGGTAAEPAGAASVAPGDGTEQRYGEEAGR